MKKDRERRRGKDHAKSKAKSVESKVESLPHDNKELGIWGASLHAESQVNGQIIHNRLVIHDCLILKKLNNLLDVITSRSKYLIHDSDHKQPSGNSGGKSFLFMGSTGMEVVHNPRRRVSVELVDGLKKIKGKKMAKLITLRK